MKNPIWQRHVHGTCDWSNALPRTMSLSFESIFNRCIIFGCKISDGEKYRNKSQKKVTSKNVHITMVTKNHKSISHKMHNAHLSVWLSLSRPSRWCRGGIFSRYLCFGTFQRLITFTVSLPVWVSIRIELEWTWCDGGIRDSHAEHLGSNPNPQGFLQKFTGKSLQDLDISSGFLKWFF